MSEELTQDVCLKTEWNRMWGSPEHLYKLD